MENLKNKYLNGNWRSSWFRGFISIFCEVRSSPGIKIVQPRREKFTFLLELEHGINAIGSSPAGFIYLFPTGKIQIIPNPSAWAIDDPEFIRKNLEKNQIQQQQNLETPKFLERGDFSISRGGIPQKSWVWGEIFWFFSARFWGDFPQEFGFF